MKRLLTSFLVALACFAMVVAPVVAPVVADAKILSELLAAGTALSNSTTETVLASAELSANTLQRGKLIKIHGAVIATATNSTDTLNVKLRVGPTTLTGTVVGASGAVDVANNDVVVIDVTCVPRAAPAASTTVLCDGLITAPGAEGTATARAAFESLSIDTTAAQLVELTGTWSAASSGDSARADQLLVIDSI